MIHNWTAANRDPVLVSEQQVLATFAVVSGGDPNGAEDAGRAAVLAEVGYR